MLTHFNIPVTHSGHRLDRVVAEAVSGVPRRAIAHAFDTGAVRLVTGEGEATRIGKGDRSHAGTRLHVERLYEAADFRVLPEREALDILYEDERLVAINKPGGQDCHPLRPGETGTLAGSLVARYPEMAAIGPDPMMASLLHRIDAVTSGLVLAARTPAAFASVRAQFTAHAIEKRYVAWVEGTVAAPGGIATYLVHAKSGMGKMRVLHSRNAAPHGERPLRAETFYAPQSQVRRPAPQCATLLAITIHTGVTHQIRCHLASIGHPIVGDTLYGAAPCPALPPTRILLHSHAAAFTLDGHPYAFTAPLPNDIIVN